MIINGVAMKNLAVDVVIIGGGITGVGIAQFASAQGYRVQLLEQGVIGQQTSANSSKLIHGGLRYLETAQFHLVHKALHERRALLTLAPTLVKPIPFYIPIYQTSQRPSWQIRIGLSLYALLSGFDSLGRFKTLTNEQVKTLKGLKYDGLKTVFQYWDAQTDDALLTQAVARSASQLGAAITSRASCNKIEKNYQGYLVHYLKDNQANTTQAKMVINAAGPWVNQVLAKVSPAAQSEAIEWVQGSHLVLDIPAQDGIVYLESCFDNRVVFVIPWYGKTLLRTTQLEITSLEQKPIPSQQEQDYLLGIYHHYFPAHGNLEQLTAKISATFCGVRVLPKQTGNAFAKPRDTLFHSPDGHPNLLNVYGGKLTTFRSTAKSSLDWLMEQLGPRQPIADVDDLPLQ